MSKKKPAKPAAIKVIEDETPAAPEADRGGAMNVEMVAIEDLSNDPANARQHGAKNIDSIRASLKRFGQQKPIVVDGNGIIRAGNGTYQAAKQLGWKQIQIVRSPLAGSEATAYAIADNRTGELAEWDKDVLAEQLGSLQEEGIDLAEIGFDEKDLKSLLGEELPVDGATNELPNEKWMVVVILKNEAEQTAFLEEMNTAGRECKALIG